MQAVSGLILAGGMGRRMGGIEKALQPVRGRPLLEWVIERFHPQVQELMLSANRELERYAAYGFPVVNDDLRDADASAGPLAGLLAGLRACKQPLLATAPCDSPLLPADLVQRLHRSLGEADVAVATVGGRRQPVFIVARKSVEPVLAAYLRTSARKADGWYATLQTVEVAFDDQADAFANVNTPEELRTIEAQLGQA